MSSPPFVYLPLCNKACYATVDDHHHLLPHLERQLGEEGGLVLLLPRAQTQADGRPGDQASAYLVIQLGHVQLHLHQQEAGAELAHHVSPSPCGKGDILHTLLVGLCSGGCEPWRMFQIFPLGSTSQCPSTESRIINIR